MQAIIDSIQRSAQATQPTLYSLPISAEECDTYLTASFFAEIGTADIDEPTRNRLHLIARWLVNDVKSRKPSLLLYGGKGLGKTCAVRAMARMLSAIKEVKVAEGKRDYWKLSKEQRNLHEWWQALPLLTIESTAKIVELYEKYQEGFKKIMTAPLLVIDDLGIEPPKVLIFGTERTPLIDIIHYRYDKKMPTIITTNLDEKGIATLYGDRVEDRLKEMCNKIEFMGKSYRK